MTSVDFQNGIINMPDISVFRFFIKNVYNKLFGKYEGTDNTISLNKGISSSCWNTFMGYMLKEISNSSEKVHLYENTVEYFKSNMSKNLVYYTVQDNLEFGYITKDFSLERYDNKRLYKSFGEALNYSLKLYKSEVKPPLIFICEFKDNSLEILYSASFFDYKSTLSIFNTSLDVLLNIINSITDVVIPRNSLASDIRHMRNDIPQKITMSGMADVNVDNLGETTYEDYEDEEEEDMEFSKLDLYLSAFLRDVDMNAPLQAIIKEIAEQYPSRKWFIDCFVKYTYLTEDEQKYIQRYVSHGYTTINNFYRKRRFKKWHQYDNIQSAIDKMTPLDNDIKVFRYIKKDDYISKNVYSVTTFKGYLSTSINAVGVSYKFCNPKTFGKLSLMIIDVPKGTRALYPNTGETEAIFSLDTRLLLLEYNPKGEMPCKNSTKDTYKIIQVPIYRFQML